MKTTTKFWKLLPVAAAALALGGCGGGGSDDSDPTSSSGSIIDCFTANKTVNFAITIVPTSSTGTSRSTTGPMTYNGQAITGQIFFYANGAKESNYWSVASSGVTLIGSVTNNSAIVHDGSFLPQNMKPGQTVTDSNNNVSVFVGFETIELAGKTFTNTCHFSGVANIGTTGDVWYAPEYGLVKSIEGDLTLQYSGDL